MKHRLRVNGDKAVRKSVTLDPQLDTAVVRLKDQHDGMTYSMSLGMLASIGAGLPTALATHTQRWPAQCPTCGAGVGEYCVKLKGTLAGRKRVNHDHASRPGGQPRAGRERDDADRFVDAFFERVQRRGEAKEIMGQARGTTNENQGN